LTIGPSKILSKIPLDPPWVPPHEIAEELDFELDKLRLELADMSADREIWRSKKGLYRLMS